MRVNNKQIPMAEGAEVCACGARFRKSENVFGYEILFFGYELLVFEYEILFFGCEN